MASVGKHIRNLRKKRNMSQEELAARIYTTRQTISNYETGRSNPDIDTLEALAIALETDVTTLLYGEHRAVEKDLKGTVRKLTIGVAVLSITVFVLFKLLGISSVIGLLLFDQLNSKVMVNTDITQYQRYMGEEADKAYRNKLGMDESIFPRSIEESMQVKDYKMVYYNPWDPQYLSYLIVQYGEDDLAREIQRLRACPMEEYRGYYGATGFQGDFDLLAMNSDSCYGFIYALLDGDTVIYVEILFCNYFMDLDYDAYIDTRYLPVGFDASTGNEYRKAMMGE